MGTRDSIYRVAVSNSQDAVIVHNQAGRIVWANEWAFRMLGYSRARLAELHFWDIDPDWTLAVIGERTAELRAGAKISRRAVFNHDTDGTIAIQACASLVEADGETHVLHNCRDISSQEGARAALRLAETRIRRLVQNVPIGAVLISRDRVELNRAASQLTGFEADTFSDLDHWFSLLYPGRAAEVRAEYERDRRAGFPTPRVVELTRRDGTKRTVRFAGYRDEDEELWILVDETHQERGRKALEVDRERAERERDYLIEEARNATPIADVKGESDELREVLTHVRAVATTSTTVLITGESGVGKERVAHAIHDSSPRAHKPLVRVNCASIPRELFESEFFGHAKGSFTGAVTQRVGRFDLADGGTLFLDEIGEVPLDLQPKLLRVLQEQAFERVGESETRRVDVRIIAATNRDLRAEVEAGRFREDLYYRLSVFPIDVPPLRHRRADIIPIAEYILERLCRDLAIEVPELTADDRDALLAYDWPGNVREVRNTLERAVILHRVRGDGLQLGRLLGGAAGMPVQDQPVRDERVLTAGELRDLERANIERALKRAGGKVGGNNGAAALLGMSRTTLTSRIKALGIDRSKG